MASDSDITEITVRGLRMKFITNNGRLKVWANRFEEIEPELLDLIDTLPRGTFFYDLGASIGLFSIYASLRCDAHVVAFEPEAQNYATLEMNRFLNRNALKYPFTALNLAISDVNGLGVIQTLTYGPGEHGKILDQAISQDTKEQFEPAHSQSVLKTQLDSVIANLSLNRPEVLKIDVDGAEAAVLRGAKQTLEDRRLHTIFIEVFGSTSSIEEEIIKSYGFQLIKRSPIVRLRGGFYPNLFNCTFRRA